jgi:hypothetical protein
MAESTAPLTSLMKNPSLLGENGNDDIEKALASLRESMARRESQIDPTMLAISRGFFAPTKTGSFGESLGNVAESYLKAQPEAEKQYQENAMMRLQMAQLAGQSKQQKSAQQYLQNRLSPTTEGEQATPQQQIESAVPASTKVPTSKGDLSREEISMIALSNPQLGAILEKEYKDKLDAIGAQPGFIFDKITGKVTPVVNPGGELKAEFIPEINGTLMMDPLDVIPLREARRKGDVESFNKIINLYQKGLGSNVSKDVVSGEAKESTAPKFMTVEEREAQKLKDQELAKLRAKGEDTRFQEILNTSKDVPAKLATYGVTKELVNKKGMEKVLGIFERPDFMSAVGKLIESGIGVSGFKIGQDNIRDIMKDLGLPQDLINDSQLIASQIANINFGFRSLAKGQGAISNFEQEMFNSMGPTVKDNVQTIQKKLSMLEERAKFEQNIAMSLRKSKMDSDDFRDSPKYQQLVNDYHKRLIGIVSPEKAQSNASTAPSEAGDILRKKLNLR